MCHYFTTIHTYEGCKLLEKNDLPVEDLSPSTATATASPTPTPKPVTHMARLLRAIAKNPSSGNVANDPSSSVVPEPEAELEQEMHVVNKKTYLQCSNARANKDLADSPDERYCLNASRVQMVDEDLLVEPDNTVPTQLRGVCRVCRAAEEAANRAMDWTEVVSTIHVRRLDLCLGLTFDSGQSQMLYQQRRPRQLQYLRLAICILLEVIVE